MELPKQSMKQLELNFSQRMSGWGDGDPAIQRKSYLGTVFIQYIRYIGMENTEIEFDHNMNHWVMTDMTFPFSSLVVGNHEWMMVNDRKCQEGSHKAILSVAACKHEKYTCKCKNNSDELQCIILVRDD
jgi:hypothetical protein